MHNLYIYSCNLESVLDQFNIGFNESLQSSIRSLLNSEKHHVKPLESAKLKDLILLAEKIQDFLDPLQDSLNTLAFFWLNPSKLFKLYIKHYTMKMVASKSRHMYTIPHQSYLLRQKKNEAFNICVKSVISLLKTICNGSATVAEVTCNNSLQLSDIHADAEYDILKLFAKFFFKEEFVGLKGVAAILELLKLYEYIFTIKEVCSQHSLIHCLEDPNMGKLLEIAKKLNKENRGEITMMTAVEMLDTVKKHLFLMNKKSVNNLKIFSAIKENIAFVQFANDRGFIGRSGRIRFNKMYNIVSSQLQHEPYEEVILSQLLGCFDYVEPFLNKEANLKQLMKAISLLENVANGIKLLKTVNKSIILIRSWFEVSNFKND